MSLTSRMNSSSPVKLMQSLIEDLQDNPALLEAESDKILFKLIESMENLIPDITKVIFDRDPASIDQSGIMTHTCFNCGSNIFKIRVTFDDYEIGLMWPDGQCVMCHSTVSVPVPWEHPNWDPEKKEITKPLPPVDEDVLYDDEEDEY